MSSKVKIYKPMRCRPYLHLNALKCDLCRQKHIWLWKQQEAKPKSMQWHDGQSGEMAATFTFDITASFISIPQSSPFKCQHLSLVMSEMLGAHCIMGWTKWRQSQPCTVSLGNHFARTLVYSTPITPEQEPLTATWHVYRCWFIPDVSCHYEQLVN